MPYILRSQARAAVDPIYEAYEPMSVSAWSEEPDLSIAPVEAWEAVEDLEAALQEAPEFRLKVVEPEAVVDEEVSDN